MFLKTKSIIFKIRRSKVTDYAALIWVSMFFVDGACWLSLVRCGTLLYRFLNFVIFLSLVEAFE